MRQQEQLLVPIDADDRLGLMALAALSSIDDADAPRFQALVSDTLRRGLTSRLADVGLSSPPSPTAVQTVLEQLAAIEASAKDQPSAPSPPLHAASSAGPTPSARPASTSGHHRLRTSSLALAGLAFAVALVGGYAGRWAWTGFTANRQLWNWMQLLLLPVALGTFPLWLRFASRMTHARRQALFGAVVGFGLFVAAGYLWPLLWTGFRGNTLWNWLTLLLLPVALTTLRLWPTTRREIHRGHVVAFASLGVAWVITILGGYFGHWAWTGYQGNTLWDWLELLLAPIAVNTVYVQATVRWISGDVGTLAEKAAAEEARLAAWLEIRAAATSTRPSSPAEQADAAAGPPPGGAPGLV